MDLIHRLLIKQKKQKSATAFALKDLLKEKKKKGKTVCFGKENMRENGVLSR